MSFPFIDLTLYSSGFSSSFHQIPPPKKKTTQSEHLLQPMFSNTPALYIWETTTTYNDHPNLTTQRTLNESPRYMTLIKVSICQRRLGENFSTAMQILLHNSSWWPLMRCHVCFGNIYIYRNIYTCIFLYIYIIYLGSVFVCVCCSRSLK